MRTKPNSCALIDKEEDHFKYLGASVESDINEKLKA